MQMRDAAVVFVAAVVADEKATLGHVVEVAATLQHIRRAPCVATDRLEARLMETAHWGTAAPVKIAAGGEAVYDAVNDAVATAAGKGDQETPAEDEPRAAEVPGDAPGQAAMASAAGEGAAETPTAAEARAAAAADAPAGRPEGYKSWYACAESCQQPPSEDADAKL